MMLIQCDIRHLHARADERGYDRSAVEACVVSRHGEAIVVDVDHPAYPRARAATRPAAGAFGWAALHAAADAVVPWCPLAAAAIAYGGFLRPTDPPVRWQQTADRLTRYPLDPSTPDHFAAWATAFHNSTNRRLGKRPHRPSLRPDRVVILSLDSRPDRWATITASVATSRVLRDVPVVRWRARPPGEMIVPDWWAWGDTIYATGIDHRDIIERAYADGLESVLILEDDAVLQDGFDAAYAAATTALPAGWLGLWLTSDGHKRPPVPVAPGLVRCTDQAMLHAYLLNRAGMRRVWHHLVTCYRQIVDGATEDLHGIEPHFYATATNAVRQYGDRFVGQRVEFFEQRAAESH